MKRWLIVPLTVVVSALMASPSTAAPDGSQGDALGFSYIDQKTLAVMRHQERLTPAVEALYSAIPVHEPDGFMSVAFENGGVALYWKGELPGDVRRGLQRARALGRVDVRPARFSRAELEARAAKIEAAAGALGPVARDTDIQAITLVHDGSGLEVLKKPPVISNDATLDGRRGVRSAEQVVSEAEVDVPVRTRVSPVQPRRLDGRRDDRSPWNGGVFITNLDAKVGAPHEWVCTTGFGVHNGRGSYLVTAGHCTHNNDRISGFLPSQFIGTACGEDWDKDLAVICAPGYHRMYDGDQYTSNYKNVHGWGYHVINELLCHSGARSGVTCGLKTLSGDYANYGCDSDGDCFTMHGLIRTVNINGETTARGGDSGGPVFSLMGAGVRAKGILSAGEGTMMLFQDWADLIRIWGFYPHVVAQ